MGAWRRSGADAHRVPGRDPDLARRQVLEAELADPVALHARRVLVDLLAERGAALAHRTTSPGHLTGSALVVSHDGARVAVLLHRKLGRWLQPGGHADGDLDLAGVALREASEETGIEGLSVLEPAVDVDVHRVDHGDELGAHLHLDTRFVVCAPAGAVLQGNHESRDLRWVTPDELERLSDEESLHRLVRVGLAAWHAAVDSGAI